MSLLLVQLLSSQLTFGINWLARSASKFSWQFSFREDSFFVILTNGLRSSELSLSSTFEPRIQLQSSASNFDGPAAPFVLMFIFWIKSSVISLNTISCVSLIGSCKRIVYNLGLASGCFMLSCCLASSVRFRTPLSEFSESNLSVLFMSPVLMKCVKVFLMYSSFLVV